MHKTLTLPLAALTAMLFVAGCGSQEGETIFTAGPTTDTVGGKAPKGGTYKLFTAASPNPTLTVSVDEGAPLGFRKNAEGNIEAFYNDKTHVLNKGTAQAYWKHQKN
ncbi:MAG TPA: hypothetical protein VK324_15360 [Tepidisphaeraceae bacterium]|nr:hypothetical protein [Tepidisphaeraceae bacterium]